MLDLQIMVLVQQKLAEVYKKVLSKYLSLSYSNVCKLLIT